MRERLTDTITRRRFPLFGISLLALLVAMPVSLSPVSLMACTTLAESASPQSPPATSPEATGRVVQKGTQYVLENLNGGNLEQNRGGLLTWEASATQAIMLDLTGVPLVNDGNPMRVVAPGTSLSLQVQSGASVGCYSYDIWVRIGGAGRWMDVDGAAECPGAGLAPDGRPKIIVN